MLINLHPWQMAKLYFPPPFSKRSYHSRGKDALCTLSIGNRISFSRFLIIKYALWRPCGKRVYLVAKIFIVNEFSFWHGSNLKICTRQASLIDLGFNCSLLQRNIPVLWQIQRFFNTVAFLCVVCVDRIVLLPSRLEPGSFDLWVQLENPWVTLTWLIDKSLIHIYSKFMKLANHILPWLFFKLQ